MSRRALPLVALLAVPFSGCFDFGEALSDFQIEYRVVGEEKETWHSSDTNVTFATPPITLTKTNPGPLGGGGVLKRLADPVGNRTIQVRLVDAAKQPRGLELQVDMILPDGVQTRTLRGNLSEVMSFEVIGAGRYNIVAFLGRGLMKDSSPRTFSFDLEAQWRITSSVHPQRLEQQPTPTNYAEMADAFEFLVAGPGYIDARTRFTGEWPSAAGTDVDLEVQTPVESAIACKGMGGGNNPQPHPNQATEQALVPTVGITGIWTVRVGALSAKCPGSTTSYYHNAGSVPYELLLSVRGNLPTKQ